VLLAARVLGLLVLAAGGTAAWTPLPSLLARRLVTPDPPGPADAIVALAAVARADGTLQDKSLRRLIRAVELYAEGRAPLLVLSGSLPGAGVDEARLRMELAGRLGVPSSAILAIGGSRTTWEEARATAARLEPHGLRRVLVVTDWCHAGRARAAFLRAGLDARVAVTGRPADAARTAGERLALAWHCLREMAATVYYRLAGFA
jgi:uncharacterized SAM-binding protein YcdF (DUF218 family)